MALKRAFGMSQQNGEAEILIFEEIGASWWGGGITAKGFADELKALGDLHTINVRINSPGGDVFDGIAIYNTLTTHKAKVNTFIDGLAASIASIIALAGDKVTIAENGLMMLHQPWTVAIGDAREMNKTADTLDKISEALVVTYAKRSGKDSKAIVKMMDAETWLTGQEAVDQGFADVVTPMKAVDASFKMCAKYKHAPAALLQSESEIPAAFDDVATMRLRLDLLQKTF